MKSAMKSDRGTRRADLQRRQRKKPRPLWLQRGLKVAGLALVLGTIAGTPYWLWSSGWLPNKIDRMENALLARTSVAGLQSDNIFVTGRSETVAADVMMALNVHKDQPLLTFSPAEAKQRLENLPWVREASVQRRFPNTIVVNLTERQPIGFLQKDRQLSLVDASGTILAKDGLGRWAGLPILIGEQAPQQAPELMKILNGHPEIYRRVAAMTYISQRRWDLHLDNKITVMLPEEDMAGALVRLDRVQQESRLLEKDIASIDLRLADRMAINPTASATARRNAPKEGI